MFFILDLYTYSPISVPTKVLRWHLSISPNRGGVPTARLSSESRRSTRTKPSFRCGPRLGRSTIRWRMRDHTGGQEPWRRHRLYKDSSSANSGNVRSILTPAHKFKIQLLVSVCEEVLLGENTSLEHLVLADKYKLQRLKDKCWSFLIQSISLEDAIRDESFKVCQKS